MPSYEFFSPSSNVIDGNSFTEENYYQPNEKLSIHWFTDPTLNCYVAGQIDPL